MSQQLHHPHDNFARKALSDITVAKELVSKHLPPEIVKRIDIDSLQLTNKSFVTENLTNYHSDVLYKCTFDKKQGYLYFLVEHQSTPDEELPLRMLEYNVQIMRQYFNEGHKKLPIIINECIYAGDTKPYPYPTNIYDYFEDPELAKKVMFKSFILNDLTSKTQEELLKDGSFGLVETILKQGRERDHVNWVIQNLGIIAQLAETSFFNSSIEYLLGTDSVNEPDALVKALVSATPDPNKQKNVMTALEKLQEKGRVEGRLEGRQEGKLETAKNMLQFGISRENIAQMTGLTAGDLRMI